MALTKFYDAISSFGTTKSLRDIECVTILDEIVTMLEKKINMKSKKNESENFLVKNGESRASDAFPVLFKCYVCITYTFPLSDIAYNLQSCAHISYEK